MRSWPPPRARRVLDPEVQRRLVAAAGSGGVPAGAEPAPDGLTPREGEVLALIAAGLSNREVAARLYLTEATVKSHINRLFAKTGVRDRAQAVQYAYRHGIATPG
jgi:DNA-binding NarL/FixJ family response regulator